MNLEEANVNVINYRPIINVEEICERLNALEAPLSQEQKKQLEELDARTDSIYQTLIDEYSEIEFAQRRIVLYAEWIKERDRILSALL